MSSDAGRCASCGKPRTNDLRCPRCGGEWNRIMVDARNLIDSALDVRVHGHGVIRRSGEIVRQTENPG